jgi:hypothetical protein
MIERDPSRQDSFVLCRFTAAAARSANQLPLVTSVSFWRRVARIDGENASSAVGGPPDAKPATSTTTWERRGRSRLKPCPGKPFELSNGLEFESQKGNPR